MAAGSAPSSPPACSLCPVCRNKLDIPGASTTRRVGTDQPALRLGTCTHCNQQYWVRDDSFKCQSCAGGSRSARPVLYHSGSPAPASDSDWEWMCDNPQCDLPGPYLFP